jgi:hypothetical protein
MGWFVALSAAIYVATAQQLHDAVARDQRPLSRRLGLRPGPGIDADAAVRTARRQPWPAVVRWSL